MKKIASYLRFLFFLLPVFFAYLVISSQDPFFVILFLASLGLAVFISFPNLLSGKHVSLPSAKLDVGSARRKGSLLVKNFSLPSLKKKSKVKKTGKASVKRKLPASLKFLSLAVFALLFFAGVVFFGWAMIFKLSAPSFSVDLLRSYYAAWGQSLSFLWVYVLAFFLIVLLLFFLSSFLVSGAGLKVKNLLQVLVKSLLLSLMVGVLSLHFVLLLGLGYRSFQLKSLASTLTSDPGQAGVWVGKDKVLERLKGMEEAPLITQKTLEDSDLKKTVASLNFSQNQEYSEFFNLTLTEKTPSFLWPEMKLPDANMMIVGQRLLILKLDKDEMEVISPQLGYLLVKSYVGKRSLKQVSDNLAVLNRQEYLEFRDDQINKKLEEIDASIAAISSRIVGIRNQMRQVIVQYFSGQIGLYDAINRLDSLEATIYDLQGQQAELREARVFVAAQKDRAPDELGLFLPEEEMAIKVVLDFDNPEALKDFLAILVHEYYHYVSYADEERYLLPFFEEGLTEYYARQTLSQVENLETIVGYPVIVKVINVLAQKLPKDKLQEVYFTKDQEMMENLLNDAYGGKFYEDSEYHFLLIPFSPPDKAVKLANDIMGEIGGEKLDLDTIIKEYEEATASGKIEN